MIYLVKLVPHSNVTVSLTYTYCVSGTVVILAPKIFKNFNIKIRTYQKSKFDKASAETKKPLSLSRLRVIHSWYYLYSCYYYWALPRNWKCDDVWTRVWYSSMSSSMSSAELPDLRTREEIHGYLKDLSSQLGLSLSDPQFAVALDSRDQLKKLREEFNIPKIGELLEGRAKADGIKLRTTIIIY